MDSRDLERLRHIFARSVHAFAAEPSAENFNRYRIAGLALDAAREHATPAEMAMRRRVAGRGMRTEAA